MTGIQMAPASLVDERKVSLHDFSAFSTSSYYHGSPPPELRLLTWIHFTISMIEEPINFILYTSKVAQSVREAQSVGKALTALRLTITYMVEFWHVAIISFTWEKIS